jgi:hypothetical protein
MVDCGDDLITASNDVAHGNVGFRTHNAASVLEYPRRTHRSASLDSVEGPWDRASDVNPQLSQFQSFADVDWKSVPDEPGVYVIYEGEEALYVGMAGRNGKGSLRNRLRDHRSGQIVNMFAQYLFLARVQFIAEERITHPRVAKAACRKYLEERCGFRYAPTEDGAEAWKLEEQLKATLLPALNPA